MQQVRLAYFECIQLQKIGDFRCSNYDKVIFVWGWVMSKTFEFLLKRLNIYCSTLSKCIKFRLGLFFYKLFIGLMRRYVAHNSKGIFLWKLQIVSCLLDSGYFLGWIYKIAYNFQFIFMILSQILQINSVDFWLFCFQCYLLCGIYGFNDG